MKDANKIWRTCFFCLLFYFSNHVRAQQSPAKYSLIPYPQKLIPRSGSFLLNAETAIITNTDRLFENEIKLLNELFENSFGKRLNQISNTTGRSIKLNYDPVINAPEGYRLEITPKQVILSAKFPVGMFRCVETLRQLLPPAAEIKNNYDGKSLELPALLIEDAPTFPWRGIHLDVSRHFFSIDYLKKLVDLLALYKMNKFHLHLTDDQGWRIEIKKYPKLTEEGAWRSFNKLDSVCTERSKDNPDFIIDPQHVIKRDGKLLYGGFYTQAQMKEFVAYAAVRHIDIVPEIDMPGHMMAAINSYKYLSCDSTSTFGQYFSTPICPCNPATLEFAKDIFSEIIDLFPYEYIHIGGDEVERTHWERSPACKAMMQEKGMTSSADLQAWFIKEMEDFFIAKGKKLLGWDEIMEGGVSNTAAIMYWRTWMPQAPAKAAKSGNDVIMTPVSPLYFSPQPDRNSLSAVYNYEIIPEGLSALEAENVKGAQGNLWSEYIPTEQRADYLYMPRMTALAEILWTGKKDYASYLKRLKGHFRRLDNLKVSYRLPDLPLLDNYVFSEQMSFTINKPLEDLVIHYTTDGSRPTKNSPVLKDKLLINNSQFLSITAFKSDGRRSDKYEVGFIKQDFARSVDINASKPGLQCKWFRKAFDSTIHISGNPDKIFSVDDFRIPKEAEAPSFTLQYDGYINVPWKGVYTLYLTSNDASVLKIAGREVINNDGMHSLKEKNGQVSLEKGLHKIALDFIEGGGGYTLKLQYSFNGTEQLDIPADWLKH